MASFEGENARVIDKFNGENFNLWKFKMEMVLASMDLWAIMDGSEEAPPSKSDPKVIKEYQRHAKNAMSTIAINLVDSQLHHIKRCKGPREAWNTLCNIHETRSLSNILFIRRKFFTCKMQEGEDLLVLKTIGSEERLLIQKPEITQVCEQCLERVFQLSSNLALYSLPCTTTLTNHMG